MPSRTPGPKALTGGLSMVMMPMPSSISKRTTGLSAAPFAMAFHSQIASAAPGAQFVWQPSLVQEGALEIGPILAIAGGKKRAASSRQRQLAGTAGAGREACGVGAGEV